MNQLSIALCGPPAVTAGHRPVAGLTSAKMQALLAYLAVEDDRPHPRSVLAALLWPERDEQTARQNLRQTLSRLRRAVGEDLLAVSRSDAAWGSRDGVTVDYWAIRDAARQVARHDHAAPDACADCCARMEAAVGLFRGDFLAGLEPDSMPLEEWLLLQREWLRREVLSFHHHLVAHHERLGRLEQALPHAWAQIELDPLRETAHQQLMRLLARTGRFSDALAHYDSLRRRLALELGVEPAEETSALVSRIRRGELTPAPAAPAIRLPTTFTPLVGRERELARIDARLAGEGGALLTITGPGGVGKSRLAIAAARARADDYPDGVTFVDLTEAATAGAAVDAVAAALDVGFSPDADAGARQTTLLQTLTPRRALLLIDNYEQLLPDVTLPLALLETAPRLDLLITSRAPLGLHAETALPLDGLDPGDDEAAVALFTAAARRARVGYAPDEADREAIRAIARGVAGLPLGLELAAALVRHYPVATIARELAVSLDFAAGSMPDRPVRHRSLRAVYDHSLSLLHDSARRALRRLAIFSGPFSYEAASALLDGDLAPLRRLQEFGLLGNTEQGLLRLHPLLHQYAREGLTGDALADAAAAHAAYVVDRLAALAPGGDFLARFRRAEADVHAAWNWALATGRGDLLQGMLPSLTRYYTLSGHVDVGLALMATALADWGDGDPDVRRALLYAEGRFAYRLGRYDRAVRALRAGIALAADETAAEARIRGQLLLAHTLTNQGAYAEGLAVLDEALGLARAQGLAVLEGHLLRSIGNIHSNRGRLPAARAAYEQALPLSDPVETRGRAATLSNLGSICVRTGDFAAARRYEEEAIRLHRLAEDGYSEAITRCDLAMLSFYEGAFAAAEAQLAEAHGLLPPAGMEHIAADFQLWQVELALARHQYNRAQAILDVAEGVYTAVGEALGLTHARLLRGQLLLALGMLEQAEALLRQVLAEAEGLGDLEGQDTARVELARLLLETDRAAEAIPLAEAALTASTAAERIPQAAAAQLVLAAALWAAGQPAAARSAARAALAQHRLLGQSHLAAEPLALLIRLALAAEETPPAGLLAELDAILEQWRGDGLLRFAAVYLAAVDGHLALGNGAAARRLLTAGQMRLALAAESLERPAWRHAVTTRVAANRDLLGRG